MIKADARLSIKWLGLDEIQVCQFEERYPERLALYMHLLKEHPKDHAGLLFVEPSQTQPGMYTLTDGHHKFCAALMTGRHGALCVIIEEEVV